MAYFQFNGFPCVDPYSLANELEALSSSPIPMDASPDEWYGKANAFCHRRGVDPSEGYLLVPNAAYDPKDNSELIIGFDGQPTTTPQGKPLSAQQRAQTQTLYRKSFKVQVDWARKASPASQPSQGYYFIRVTDARISLASQLVGKRFNYPLNYKPNPISSSLPGEFIYHEETLKEDQNKVGETIYRPYTWEELFKECFLLPGEQTSSLTTLRVVYPEYTPQDLDFRYVTRRDALEMLCQWCNISIEWDGLNGYKLIQVKNGQQGDIATLLNAHRRRETKNAFPKYNEVPQKFALHFPYLQPKSQHTSIYHVNANIGFEGGNGETLSLWLPCVKIEGAAPPTTQNPDTIPPKFRDLQRGYYDQLPSQEKIYSGAIFQSPGASSQQGPDAALQLKPSGYLESVVWYDIGKGPRTKINSISLRNWLIGPRPVIQRGLVAAVGKVVGQVTESTPTIRVKQLRLVNPTGCLPLGVEQLTEDYILSRNTFAKVYGDGDRILVFGEDYSQLWDTDNSGGTSSDPVVRFEIIEDKPLKSFAVKAVLLDEYGVALPEKDPDDPQKDSENVIYVIDGQQRFAGYKRRVDPKYGEQRGFVGAAVKVLDNYEFGNQNSPPGHVILEMEHVARYVEGRLREAFNPDNGETEGTVLIDDYWDGRAPSTKKITSGTTGGVSDYVVDFLDRQKFFGKLDAKAKVKLVFDETVTEFKTNETPSGGGGPETEPSKYILWGAISKETFPVIYAWCDSDVPAVTLNPQNKKGTWGSKELQKMIETDDGIEVPIDPDDVKMVVAKNSSASKIRGSYDEPLILIGVSKIVDKTFPSGTNIEDIPPSERQEEIMLVMNWIDPRGFENFIRDKAQGVFHRPGQRGFELGGKDCQNTATT